MTPSILTTILTSLKIITLVGVGVYIIFASIIVRQEQLMSGVLEEQFEPILRIIAFIHLVASIGVFLLALVML